MARYARLISKLPWIITQTDRRVQSIIEGTLLSIEEEAKARSRVDTGQMRAGWTAQMTGKHEGVVFNLVQHTIFNEYGTVNMPAQPMLAPAVEGHEEAMLQAIKDAYEGKGGGPNITDRGFYS